MSSRQQKADKLHARPEDFMDEEVRTRTAEMCFRQCNLIDGAHFLQSGCRNNSDLPAERSLSADAAVVVVVVVCQDLGEHGIAPREITTSQEFSSSRRDKASEKARAVSAQAALIPGDTLLEELIAPAR